MLHMTADKRRPAGAVGMSVSGYFSDTYVVARDMFRAAAREAGADLEVHQNPTRGPDGERLTTDVAYLGADDPARLFVVLAGTHGVEGFCGSGIEVGWLASGLANVLPADTAAVLIHALNPYGFAWLRRVNEMNIDINRNFIDRSQPYPANPGYEQLRDAICPKEWTPEALAAAQRVLDAYIQRHGWDALESAVTAGQYTHPEGLFYGGAEPSWSARIFLHSLRRHAGAARHVAFLDLHTGLGPHGCGEIISNHPPGTGGHRRALQWFGSELTSPEAGTSSSAAVEGEITRGVTEAFSSADVTGVTVEFGTVSKEEVFMSLRADNWLHAHGRVDSPLGREIKAGIRRAFYSDTDRWKRMVWERAMEVRGRTLAALAAA